MENEFVQLLNKHPGILYKICHVYCQEEEDRKDLFQEMVLQLWKAFPTFRNDSNASTWMYRVALNTAISSYRKGMRRPRSVELSLSLWQIPDFPDGEPEKISHLYAAIEKLSPVEKALVTLYLDEKSYEEIALILGISKSNVGVKLSRIKLKLEKMVKSVTY